MAVYITDTASTDRDWEPNSTSEGQHNTSSIFSDLLVSGAEIEGMFQQKRKQERDRKNSGKKSGPNGLTDPVAILKDRLRIYNDKRNDTYHLAVNEEVSAVCMLWVLFTVSIKLIYMNVVSILVEFSSSLKFRLHKQQIVFELMTCPINCCLFVGSVLPKACK